MQLLYSIITVLCLCIGFYFGFKIGKTDELPKIIIKSKKEKQEEKELTKELNILEKSINNLNRYGGTSEGQEDIGNE